MDPIEVRRLFIQDKVWERTSDSWKDLMPYRDFNSRREGEEFAEQYCARLQPRFNIPLEVVDQWLYRLYYDIRSVKNYGWLDYDKVTFSEAMMPAITLSELNILEECCGWVNTRKACVPFQDFICRPQDTTHWKDKGTWRVPPIVLDVATLSDIPAYAEIKGPYQLVEGHTRLGYLLSLLKWRFVAPESEHRVYLMSIG